VDTTAPDTTIGSGPAALTNSSSASIAFSAEAGATYQCKLDAGAYEACTSPAEHTGLADGEHTVLVRATDAAGNTDQSPASRTWTVDTAAPNTTIDSGPAATSTATTATLTFSAEAGATYECKLDAAVYAACTSPVELTGLAVGDHTFMVRATDGAGNTDQTPASYTWTVEAPAPPPDTEAPNTTLDSSPDATTEDTTAAFTFSSEAGATYECKLDVQAFAACTSPAEYTGLAIGEHTFAVRATDAAGNTDASPATTTWTIEAPAPVDTTAPVAEAPVETVAAPSTLGTTTVPVKVSWPAATDANGIDTYELQQSVDEGAYTDVTLATPTSLEATVNLAPGTSTYRFRIRAIDPTGNASEWAEGPLFTVSQLQETATTLTYTGTWTQATLSGASGGSVKHANAGTARVSHAFTGRSVALVMAKGPSRGIATVYLDGVLVQTLDLYTASLQTRQIVYAASFDADVDPEAVHTIEVRVTGTKNAAATGRRVDLDAVVVVQAPDTEAPDTTIDSTPEDVTEDTTAEFTFSATETGSTFECSVDGAAFAPCTSPASYTDLAVGEHTFRVKATDAAGNADESPATFTWTVEAPGPTDTTPPVAQAPAASVPSPSQLGTSTVTLTVSWPAATDENGIDRYELQRSTNGGAYADVVLGTPTSLEAAVSQAPGSTYRFRLRAVDPSGNASAWAEGPSFALSQLQETDTVLTYTGSWTQANVSGASGGAVKYANASTARVSHAFTGRGVALVMVKGANRGKANVFLDGVLVKTLDLYASSIQARQIVYSASFASSAAHTIEVRVLGTRNASSTGYRVDLDAVVVLG
jgi:large repetitive protein